jgi:hypothetical protein
MLVHELRYLLTFGGGAGRALYQQGHQYLSPITPLIVFLAALGLGAFLCRLAAARRTGRGARRPGSFTRLWLFAASGLLLIYVGQETLEGIFASGHPAGIAGVFGDGGLWSVPAAVCVGGLLAVLLTAARRTINLVAASGLPRPVTPRPPRIRRRPRSALLPSPNPLSRRLAGRGPPGIAAST